MLSNIRWRPFDGCSDKGLLWLFGPKVMRDVVRHVGRTEMAVTHGEIIPAINVLTVTIATARSGAEIGRCLAEAKAAGVRWVIHNDRVWDATTGDEESWQYLAREEQR
jgi:hypothetical protein